MQTLEETLSAESVRLTVAIRFVEWFTSRGVQYEHNLQVIDRHLGNLTKSAHPGNRNPFEGQIRFESVLMNFNVCRQFALSVRVICLIYIFRSLFIYGDDFGLAAVSIL